MIRWIFALFIVGSVHAQGVHQHGHISLDVAIDGREIGAELRGPAQSFIGFEHKAKTRAEKKLVSDVEAKLRTSALEHFGFDQKLECKVVDYSVKWIRTDHAHSHGHDHDKHSGEHSELKASYKFKCEKAIKNTKLNISFKKEFKQIEQIDLAVLPSVGNAFAITIKTDEQSVKLP